VPREARVPQIGDTRKEEHAGVGGQQPAEAFLGNSDRERYNRSRHPPAWGPKNLYLKILRSLRVCGLPANEVLPRRQQTLTERKSVVRRDHFPTFTQRERIEMSNFIATGRRISLHGT
jgi:hypothetical protein